MSGGSGYRELQSSGLVALYLAIHSKLIFYIADHPCGHLLAGRSFDPQVRYWTRMGDE